MKIRYYGLKREKIHNVTHKKGLLLQIYHVKFDSGY